MKKIILSVMVVSMMLTLNSCFSNRKVERVSPNEQIDLSGRWNDTDSRLAAEEMIRQVLGEKWLARFEQANNGKRPVVVVGVVSNKSHEHIETETFIKDLERAIIQNGSVRLVQAGAKREELRSERADQQEFASPQTAKRWGKEMGADFILQGALNAIVDSYGKEKVVSYQINLELTDLETNEIVWIGDKKIKKYIRN